MCIYIIPIYIYIYIYTYIYVVRRVAAIIYLFIRMCFFRAELGIMLGPKIKSESAPRVSN